MRRWAWLVFALLWNLGVAVACLLALRSSPYLDASIHASGVLSPCAWKVDLPGVGTRCLVAIEDVVLQSWSLVREPVYLESGDEIRGWEGDQADLYQRVRGEREARLTLLDGGRTDPIRVPVRPFRWADLLPGQVPTLLVVMGTLAISGFVFLRRPERPESKRLLAVFTVNATAMLITLVNASRGLALADAWRPLLLHLNNAAVLATDMALVSLFSVFPVRRVPRWNTPLFVVVPGLVAGVAFALGMAGALGLYNLANALLVLTALALMIWAQVRVPDPISRLQARWVLWGFLVPILLWCVGRLPMMLGWIRVGDSTDVIVNISILAVPVGLAVAILRYRLFDIEVVIRRTALGAAAVAVALFLYHQVVSTLAGALDPASSLSVERTFLIGLVLTLALLPTQGAADRLVRRVFPRAEQRRRAFAQLPYRLAVATSGEAAARLVLEAMAAAGWSRSAVAFQGSGRGAWTWTDGSAPHAPSPDVGLPFWEDLVRVGDMRIGPSDADPDAVDRWMARQDLDVLVPLRTPSGRLGILACGGGPRTAVLGRDDLEGLRTAASSLALSMDHSLAFESLAAIQRDLEARVQRRMDDLLEVRLQLFQWEKMASMGVLSAGIAHELNTPLGVVASTSEQLARHLERTDPEGRALRLARLCREGTARASAIVQDIRGLSRPESQSVQVVDVRELVETTLRLLGHHFQGKDVELRVSLEPVPLVEGYPALIHQTVANLVLNGLAALSGPGWLQVATRPGAGDTACIVVGDSGPGLPEPVRERLFRRIVSTRTEGSSPGMGLLLCATFVRAHGGRIWEEGEPGAGCRFVVELPPRVPPGGPQVDTGKILLGWKERREE